MKLTNFSTARTNAWTAESETSTYDNSGTWTVCTPVFHWAAGTDHVITATASKTDILTFWTFGGDDPTIYSAISGQDFLT